MEKVLCQLISLLDQQIAMIKHLINLAAQKTDILVSTSADKIGDIIYEEQEAQLELERVEKRRLALVDEIAVLSGFSDKNASLSEVIAQADEPFASELNGKRSELQKQLDDYKERSEINTALIASNLNYVDYMIHAIMDQKAPSAIYGSKGYMQQEDGARRFFDNKV